MVYIYNSIQHKADVSTESSFLLPVFYRAIWSFGIIEKSFFLSNYIT